MSDSRYTVKEKLKMIKGFPKEFQDRFDRFDSLFAKEVEGLNPFLNDDLSDYEVFVCSEAVNFAKKLKKKKLTEKFKNCETMGDMYDLLKSIRLPSRKKHHSGNTLGSAVNMAFIYLTRPELIPYMHGSLAVLVGDEGYHDDRSDIPTGLFA